MQEKAPRWLDMPLLVLIPESEEEVPHGSAKRDQSSDPKSTEVNGMLSINLI